MKIIYRTAVFLAPLLVLISCLEGKKKQSVKVNTPQEIKDGKAVVPDQFDQEFIDGMTGTLWNYYSEMRMALVNSDASQTSTVAKYLAESFGDKHGDLKSIAQEMSDTDDIEQQRKLFYNLTQGLEPIFSKALSGGAIYKQYCPMAFDNAGAYWLSNVPEIKNPYYGEKMMDCGSVEETIESNLTN